MLRAGNALRFTPDDIEQVLTRWADTLNDERPNLLEKIAVELVNAKGIPLPARLTRVR